MKRTGILIGGKYREYFLTTLAMTGSTAIANIIDRIMVGNLLGPSSMSAISITSPVVFMSNVIYGLCIYGGNTLAATYRGRRDKKNADKCFTIAILLGILLCAMTAILGLLFFNPLAEALCASDTALIGSVKEYLFPLLFLGVLGIWTNGMAAFLRSDGLKKLSIWIPIVSNVVNLMGDYVFLKHLHLGIGSAGWATNIGMVAGAFLVIPYFRSEKRTVFFDLSGLTDLKLITDVLHTGLASAALNASLVVKNYLLNIMVISSLGSTGAVIMSVCLTGNTVASIFYIGASQTMMPIGGALYGEKDYNGIRYLFKTALGMMLSICVGIVVVLMLFPGQFAALFGVDISGMGGVFEKAFRLFCISIPFVGLQNNLRSHMQSCGYKNAATVMILLDSTVCFIPFCCLFALRIPDMIWLSFTIAPLLSMPATYVFLRLYKRQGSKCDALLLPVMTKDMKGLELSIKNDMTDVEKASMEVLTFCRLNGVDDSLGNRLWLAIQELCSNIARYAYTDGEGSADIFLKISENEVILRIRDNGVIFNPAEFIDDSGSEINGLKMLKAMNIALEYNRVIGFNNTIISLKR